MGGGAGAGACSYRAVASGGGGGHTIGDRPRHGSLGGSRVPGLQHSGRRSMRRNLRPRLRLRAQVERGVRKSGAPTLPPPLLRLPAHHGTMNCLFAPLSSAWSETPPNQPRPLLRLPRRSSDAPESVVANTTPPLQLLCTSHHGRHDHSVVPTDEQTTGAPAVAE